MADSNEPRKETVRITVSAQSGSPPRAQSESRNTVRIHLPTRPPANPSPVPVDSPCRVRSVAAAVPAPAFPKKETARITVLVDPPAKSAVQMKKTQPLIDVPKMETLSSAVTVTPQPQTPPQSAIEQIPMRLCWGLLAASAAILIFQIWNYLS